MGLQERGKEGPIIWEKGRTDSVKAGRTPRHASSLVRKSGKEKGKTFPKSKKRTAQTSLEPAAIGGEVCQMMQLC